MEELEHTPKMRFYRDIDNYVLINNDIYRKEFANPDVLNSTAITKTVFMQKFGFSQEDYLSLEEYDGYTNEPNHFDYLTDVDGKWNLYSRLNLKIEEGDWSTIEKLIKHTYGKNDVEEDQVEELYDYHTVLLKDPKQVQQARILYSHTQGTSKSAFAALEQAMFGDNYTKVRDSEISGDFNMIWIRSLIIHMDEPFFAQPAKMERLFRDIVTTKTMNLRKMKTDHMPVPFYGKLLFTSNDSNFMPINAGDRRYWIREVPSIKEADKSADFLERALSEIPAYLHYLMHERTMKYATKSDVTFYLPYEAISSSNAFKKMAQDSKDEYETVTEGIIERFFLSHPNATEVQFTLKEIREKAAVDMNIRYDATDQTKFIILLRDKLKCTQPDKNSRPKKTDNTICAEIDRSAGKWWKAYRENFNTEMAIFDKVGV